MINRIGLALLLPAFALLFSCENDLDLSGEYDETIIIYGLLDHTKDTQFVKINKSFLGDGSALDYAQEPDSFIFENIDATLTNLSDNSVITLQPISAPKKPGAFSDEKNIVYYTTAPLTGGRKYQLDVVNQKSGEHAKASTVVIDTVNLTGYLGVKGSQVNLKAPSGYIPMVVSYAVKPHVYRYETELIFNYYEYPKSNFSAGINKQIHFNLGMRLASSSSDGSVSYLFDGEEFFRKVGEKVEPDPSVEREIVDMKFVVKVASKALQQYIEVNGELDGISQVRPDFSNIENGYGIFSSTYEDTVSKVFSINSAQELKQGDYTSRLGFVDNF